MLSISVGNLGLTTEVMVVVKENGRVTEEVRIGDLINCWRAGPGARPLNDRGPADFVISYHDKVERVIPDEPSGPTDMDAAVAEIHAIKKRLAEIVSGMAPGSRLEIKLSKERR